MTEKPKITSMAVSPETLSTFRELSERTKIPLFQLMGELAREINVVLKKLSDSDRVIYMASAVKDRNYVVLNFGSMFCGTSTESLEEFEKKLKS